MFPQGEKTFQHQLERKLKRMQNMLTQYTQPILEVSSKAVGRIYHIALVESWEWSYSFLTALYGLSGAQEASSSSSGLMWAQAKANLSACKLRVK